MENSGVIIDLSSSAWSGRGRDSQENVRTEGISSSCGCRHPQGATGSVWVLSYRNMSSSTENDVRTLTHPHVHKFEGTNCGAGIIVLMRGFV